MSEERSRGKGRQKAERPLAARCMQIKQKQNARGRLSSLVRETRPERKSDRVAVVVVLAAAAAEVEEEVEEGAKGERRNGGPAKQEDPH